MDKNTEGFIKQTAKDYDMDYEKVKDIYNMVDGDLTKLYEKLEECIKEGGYISC